MTNQKEVKAARELAIVAFDRLLKDARREFCFYQSCSSCIYRIDPDSLDYDNNPNVGNCYAKRFNEEAIAMLMKKEGIL